MPLSRNEMFGKNDPFGFRDPKAANPFLQNTNTPAKPKAPTSAAPTPADSDVPKENSTQESVVAKPITSAASKSSEATESEAPKATGTDNPTPDPKPKAPVQPKAMPKPSQSKATPNKSTTKGRFMPEGTRQLYLESLYINKAKDPKKAKFPYSMSARFRYRRDVEGDKPFAGGYVTNKMKKSFPHEQELSTEDFKHILDVNNIAMPDEKTMAEAAESHRPFIRAKDNLAVQATVYYPNSKIRASNNRPLDVVSPKSIKAPSVPFDIKKEKAAEDKHRKAWNANHPKGSASFIDLSADAKHPAQPKTAPKTNTKNQALSKSMDEKINEAFNTQANTSAQQKSNDGLAR